MAIPYAGVHRKLKDADTPWEKKVDLARFAWVSARCFLPNREQVLMDWAANSLANARKLSVPEPAIPRLWQFLQDALRSQRLKTMGSRAEALSLRPSLFPVILKSLCIGHGNVELVIGCCNSLLEYPSLGGILTGSLDHQVQFLSAVVCLLNEFLRTHRERTPSLLNVLVQRAFASFAALQRQQPNPRKVFTTVYEKLLGPLLALHCTISGVSEQIDKGFFSNTLACIQDLIASGLFNRDLAECHTKYLRSIPGQVPTEKQREAQLLQESISSLWKNMAERISNRDEVNIFTCYISGMPVVFRAFLSLHKYPSDVAFAMFRLLCCTMGVVPAQEHDGKAMTGVQNQHANSDSIAEKALPEQKALLSTWTTRLPALSELLKVVAEKQIYEVASDNMSGKTQFNWLRDLSDRIITDADSSQAAWYTSLNTVLDMNHLILEDQLTAILKEALCCSDWASLAQCTQRERDEFLKKMMATYTKLRQFDRVVSAMLDVCQSASAEGQQFAYPTHFCTAFSKSIQSLPPGLTLDIWRQFLDQLLTRYLPEITQEAAAPLSPPPRKKSKPSSSKRSKVNLTVIAVTFDLFLRSMRLVDSSLTVPLLRRVKELMTDMRDRVLTSLLHLCSKAELSAGLVYPTLLLCYVWGELHLLLCQNTKYGDRLSFPVLEGTAMEFGDFSYVHTYGMSGEWQHLCTMFAEKNETKLLQVSLAVQQIRALLLYGETTSDAVRQSLDNIATAACNRATDIKNRDSSRGSLLSVLLENVPYLLPFLLTHQLTNLASLLCEVLMSSHTDSKASDSFQLKKLVHSDGHSDECRDASLYRICEEFVRSEFCVESRQLQVALVTSVLGQMAKVMRSLSAGPSAKILQELSGMDVKCINEGESSVTKMQEITSDFNKFLTNAKNVTRASCTDPTLYRSLDGVLKVLNHLPLQHLLPGNKTRCMLGLLVVDTALTGICPKKAPGAPHLSALLLCRQLQAAILKNVTSKTKFVSGVDVWRILAFMTETSIGTKLKVTKKTLPEVNFSLNDVTEELLTHWLKRLRQLPNQEAGFKDYSEMVESKLEVLNRHLSSAKNSELILSQNLPLLTVATSLLGSLFVSRSTIGSLGYKLSCDLGQPIVGALSISIRHGRGASACPRLLIWLAKAGTLLMKFVLRTVRTESLSHSSVSKSDTESDSSDEAVAMETNLSTASVAREHWTEVLTPVLQEICAFFGSTSQKSCSVIGACLMFMQTSCLFIGQCCDVSTIGMATSDMWQAVLSLMGTSVHLDEIVMNDLKSTLSGIIQTMDLVQFRTLLTDLIQDTSLKAKPDADDCPQLRGALVAWQLLPSSCAVSPEIQEALGEVIPEVMLNLMEVLKDAVHDWTHGGAVAVSVLQAVSSIVGQGKSLVSPKEAMKVQHFCLMVPVAMVTSAEFPLVFDTLCQILRSLLIGYPRTVMKSLAGYFACLQHLLKAVMHRGQQRRGADEKLSDHDLYMCAENMERLLTLLATYKTDVSKLAVFLVSHYIAELQKGTLFPLLKKTLVTGVYNLLDACDERAIDFFNASLPSNLREIFKTFYSDFQKYYRYSGRV